MICKIWLTKTSYILDQSLLSQMWLGCGVDICMPRYLSVSIDKIIYNKETWFGNLHVVVISGHVLSPSYVKPINHAVLPWPLTIGSKPTSVQRLRNLTTPPSTHLVTEVTEAVIDNCDVKNLIKLCQYWRKYEKRTKNF